MRQTSKHPEIEQQTPPPSEEVCGNCANVLSHCTCTGEFGESQRAKGKAGKAAKATFSPEGETKDLPQFKTPEKKPEESPAPGPKVEEQKPEPPSPEQPATKPPECTQETKVEVNRGPDYEVKEIIFSRKYGKDNYGSMGIMLSATPKTPQIDVLKCLNDLNDACDEYFLISLTRPPVEEPAKQEPPKTEPPKPSPFQRVPPPAAAPAPKPQAPPVDTGPKRYTIDDARMLFPEELESRISFEGKGDYIIIKPKQFLGSENFAKIASQIRGAGGEYISAGKDSHFRLPLRAGQTAPPAQAPAQGHPPIRSEEDDASLHRYGFISINVEKHLDGLIWHIVKKKDSEETYFRASKKDHEEGPEGQKFDTLKAKMESTDKGVSGGAKFGGGFSRWLFDNGDIGKKPKGGS